MLNDYAVVLSEETVHTLSEGRVQGRIAVCLVKDSVAEVHVVWPSELDRLTADLPRVPSARGSGRMLLDFEEEMEVLATIEEAVRAEVSRLSVGAPPAFMQVEPLLTAGLSLMFMEAGIDVRLSSRLAEKIRWKEGDQVRFAISVDGSIGVIHADESGASLIPSETEQGSLEVSSYLPAPVRFGTFYTEWENPTYWISDGRIYFEMDQFASDPEADDEYSESLVMSKSPGPLLDTEILQGFAVGAVVVAAVSLLARLAGF